MDEHLNGSKISSVSNFAQLGISQNRANFWASENIIPFVRVAKFLICIYWHLLKSTLILIWDMNISYRLFFVMPKWSNSRKNGTVRYWRGGGSHGYNWFRRYSILSQFCSKSKHQSSFSTFISQNWCHWFCSIRTQRCISGTKQRSIPFDFLVCKRASFDEISSHLIILSFRKRALKTTL